uniref:Sam-dependent methyltransferase n=1 Tax=Tetraselmis sp. GSL018 TaxID=582737 RepID=A0A061RL25_9CHLO
MVSRCRLVNVKDSNFGEALLPSGHDRLECSGTCSEKVDVLVALHACDTATDDALYYGISANAEVILVSPCCHKEIRKQLRSLNSGNSSADDTLGGELQDVLRHGILAERQAEILTDALRASLLESTGYDTSVFEFISGEHTSKNLMICAVRRTPGNAKKATGASNRAKSLLKSLGIRHQRLAVLLGYLSLESSINGLLSCLDIFRET